MSNSPQVASWDFFPAAQSASGGPGFDAFPKANPESLGPSNPQGGTQISSNPGLGDRLKSFLANSDPDKAIQSKQAFQGSLASRIRDSFAPVLGETKDQVLSRHADQQQLENIAPSLAAAAFDENKERQMQKGSAHTAAMTAASIALQGGGGTAGAIGGAATPIPGGAEIGAGIGGAGGNLVYQELAKAVGDQDKVYPGRVVGAGLASAIPGASLADSGTSSIVSQAAKQGIGGLAAETAEKGIDENRLPTGKEALLATAIPAAGGAIGQKLQLDNPEINAARTAAENKDASKRAILAAGQDAGLVVNPTQVNPSKINKGIVSLAGSPSVNQAATQNNSEKFNELARKVLDPNNPDLELTKEATAAVRKVAYDNGYLPVANAGSVKTDPQFKQDLQDILATSQGASRSFPGAVGDDVSAAIKPLDVDKFDAGDALKMGQILRDNASASYASGDRQLGSAQRSASKALEDQIERHLQTHGNFNGPDLLNGFRDARKLIAQSHDIEDALREGGNTIIPSTLASKAQAQKPMTGDLATIGQFANVFPQVSKEADRTMVPGTTVTGNMGKAILGTLGGAAGAAVTHSTEGAVLGAAVGAALPSVRGLVRSLVLSGPYQRIMAKIPVNVKAAPDASAALVRELSQAASESQDDHGTR